MQQRLTLTQLAEQIFSENEARGWWTDIENGTSIRQSRNRAELFALMGTEVREAYDAGLFKFMDDKLPTQYGCVAEIADTMIRVLDLCGADGIDVSKAIVNSEEDFDYLATTTWEGAILQLFLTFAEATELHRTGKSYVPAMVKACSIMLYMNARWDFDLFFVINEKRRFNKLRSDHSIESRKAKGGKKF